MAGERLQLIGSYEDTQIDAAVSAEMKAKHQKAGRHPFSGKLTRFFVENHGKIHAIPEKDIRREGGLPALQGKLIKYSQIKI